MYTLMQMARRKGYTNLIVESELFGWYGNREL